MLFLFVRHLPKFHSLLLWITVDGSLTRLTANGVKRKEEKEMERGAKRRLLVPKSESKGVVPYDFCFVIW